MDARVEAPVRMSRPNVVGRFPLGSCMPQRFAIKTTVWPPWPRPIPRCSRGGRCRPGPVRSFPNILRLCADGVGRFPTTARRFRHHGKSRKKFTARCAALTQPRLHRQRPRRWRDDLRYWVSLKSCDYGLARSAPATGHYVEVRLSMSSRITAPPLSGHILGSISDAFVIAE